MRVLELQQRIAKFRTDAQQGTAATRSVQVWSNCTFHALLWLVYQAVSSRRRCVIAAENHLHYAVYYVNRRLTRR